MNYTPPPEPMSDRQFYFVLLMLAVGVAGGTAIMCVLTWVLGVFAK